MLEVRLRLPILDGIGLEDTFDAIANFCLCTITDDGIHGSPFSYLIVECVDKLCISAATVDADIFGCTSHKNLCACMASPSRDITEYSVSSNVLVSLMYVASWVLCSSGVTYSRLRRNPGVVLGGASKSMANNISGLVEEVALVVSMIRWCWCALP